ncbi:aldose epimerase family protein [Candidatus Nitrospira bockiana]
MTITPDTELTLALGAQRAIVSPWGASLRRYFVLERGRETDVLWGYSGGGNKKGGQGDVLIPFPGRIAYGRYEFDGARYQLECNDKEGPNAIHGFLRSVAWRVEEYTATHASFAVEIDEAHYERRGYPFSLAVRVSYRLEAGGLTCSFAVGNVGANAAPVGVGFHPYFTVGTAMIDEADVRIPATHYLEMGETLAPTGRVLPVEGTPWDYRGSRRVGAARLNHCYVNLLRGPDGTCVVRLRHPREGRTIAVTMDQTFTAVVVYTGDAITAAPRRALAIEPMTCATDAFNHPAWGLIRLAPGRQLTGRYTVHMSGGSDPVIPSATD